MSRYPCNIIISYSANTTCATVNEKRKSVKRGVQRTDQGIKSMILDHFISIHCFLTDRALMSVHEREERGKGREGGGGGQ